MYLDKQCSPLTHCDIRNMKRSKERHTNKTDRKTMIKLGQKTRLHDRERTEKIINIIKCVILCNIMLSVIITKYVLRSVNAQTQRNE